MFLWFYCGKKRRLLLAINKKWDAIQTEESHACVAAVWPACCEVWGDVGVLDQEWDDDAHCSHTYSWNEKSCCGFKTKDKVLITTNILLWRFSEWMWENENGTRFFPLKQWNTDNELLALLALALLFCFAPDMTNLTVLMIRTQDHSLSFARTHTHMELYMWPSILCSRKEKG